MVFPDLDLGGWEIRKLGTVDLKATAGKETATLESYGFQPGYYFDVAYTTTGTT
jgi:hypothetical protein